jgi:hypothetical protein
MNRNDSKLLASIGLALWVVGLVALQSASLQARIFLVAPFVIVPLLLNAIPPAERPLSVAGPLALLAAAPLLGAFAVQPGAVGAALTLPWLALTGSFGIAALAAGLRGLPGILRRRRASELGLLAAFGFLGVGGLFLAFDRIGFQPGGFSAEIILLTAIHFHFAGFGAMSVTSLLARRWALMAAPVFGLLIGIPVTALGFVTGSMILNAVGASITGASGIALAVALLFDRSPRSMPLRAAWSLAGLVLLIAMPMGIAWSVAIAMGSSFLDVDQMVRTHGELNAIAVVLLAIAVPRPETP